MAWWKRINPINPIELISNTIKKNESLTLSFRYFLNESGGVTGTGSGCNCMNWMPYQLKISNKSPIQRRASLCVTGLVCAPIFPMSLRPCILLKRRFGICSLICWWLMISCSGPGRGRLMLVASQISWTTFSRSTLALTTADSGSSMVRSMILFRASSNSGNDLVRINIWALAVSSSCVAMAEYIKFENEER